MSVYNIYYRVSSFFLMSPAPHKPSSLHVGEDFVIVKPLSSRGRSYVKPLACCSSRFP